MDLLATVQNLLRRCIQPAAFLRPLSKLFSVVRSKLPRKALVSVFQVRSLRWFKINVSEGCADQPHHSVIRQLLEWFVSMSLK